MGTRLSRENAGSAHGSESASATGARGDRLANRALSMLGWLVSSLVVLVFWQIYMQTSDIYNPIEKLDGWGAVARDLPAYALALLPLFIGLSLSARAVRMGSSRGKLAAFLLSAALLVTLAMVLDTGVHQLVRPGQEWVVWLEWVAALIAAGSAAFVTARQRRGSNEGGFAVRPLPFLRRHSAAAWVGFVGLAVSLAWLGIGQLTLSMRADGFARSEVPGTLAVHVSEPGTYYVYAEGSASNDPDGLAVTVVAPSGANVTPRTMDGTPAYLLGLRSARPVATFVAVQPGSYKVSASVNPLYSRGTFAVGTSVAGWMTSSIWGADTVLIASLALASWIEIRAGREDREATQL